MQSVEQLPLLVDKEVVKTYLGTDWTEMERVSPQLHTLEIRGFVTRAAGRYVQALKSSMPATRHRSVAIRAEEFASSDTAREAIATSELIFGRLLLSKLEHSQLKETEAGISVAVLQECLNMEPSDDYALLLSSAVRLIESGGIHYIGRSTVETSFSWERPHSYPGARLAGVLPESTSDN